jgi:hypothetical protein
MHDFVCWAEPEVFLGKAKRQEAVDSISTEDDTPSRRLVSLLNTLDKRRANVHGGADGTDR